ncbi:glycosyltransferase [Bifidobacterium adolescentis]|jgi:UDP-N-acetylglucosamine transferase subunit ALG13|uniref:glycosyltransferase n=2 Tax=Bifidobacterium adolescentis TaxID=1680 RepID=UPI00189B44D2|nr:glycosyltransferase [Bifidobacterium adolescentis]MDB1413183.1 glycosyltransferase [Bifidobacterium adolescentis]
MIFVTVGTHEQSFNRLIKAVDQLKGSGAIDEDVVMQTGFSTYEPRYCEWHRLLPYAQMKEKVSEARIVITHGGPASFIMPLQIGKIPIVVPRQLQFDEHVNNHQVDFTKAVADRMGNIIPVYDITRLGDVIQRYTEIIGSMRNCGLQNNNKHFNEELMKIVDSLFLSR